MGYELHPSLHQFYSLADAQYYQEFWDNGLYLISAASWRTLYNSDPNLLPGKRLGESPMETYNRMYGSAITSEWNTNITDVVIVGKTPEESIEQRDGRFYVGYAYFTSYEAALEYAKRFREQLAQGILPAAFDYTGINNSYTNIVYEFVMPETKWMMLVDGPYAPSTEAGRKTGGIAGNGLETVPKPKDENCDRQLREWMTIGNNIGPFDVTPYYSGEGGMLSRPLIEHNNFKSKPVAEEFRRWWNDYYRKYLSAVQSNSFETRGPGGFIIDIAGSSVDAGKITAGIVTIGIVVGVDQILGTKQITDAGDPLPSDIEPNASGIALPEEAVTTEVIGDDTPGPLDGFLSGVGDAGVVVGGMLLNKGKKTLIDELADTIFGENDAIVGTPGNAGTTPSLDLSGILKLAALAGIALLAVVIIVRR